MSLKERIFGAGHRVFTVLGVVAGALVAASEYLDLIPPEYRSNKWYALAAGVVAIGAWWKKNMAEPPAPLAVVPPDVLTKAPKGFVTLRLLFAMVVAFAVCYAVAARADDTPASHPVTIGSIKGQPVVATGGIGVSGIGYDLGTKQILRGATASGLVEVCVGNVPVCALVAFGFQAGQDQGAVAQGGLEYRPLNVGALYSQVVAGSTSSKSIVAGYVVRF